METIRFLLPFLIERTSEKTGLIVLQSIQSIDFDLSKNEPKILLQSVLRKNTQFSPNRKWENFAKILRKN